MVRVLESKLAEVRADGKIEAEWKSLHNSIQLSRSFTVDEQTMGSRDMVQELTNLNLNAQGCANVTQGTKLHDQKGTNLCVYISITSALRHEMKRIVGSRRSVEINIKADGEMHSGVICIPKDKTIDEVLEQGSARRWDKTGIPVPGWDRDEFSGISGIRDGTGMSFEKPGWDRDATVNPGILAIPN